MADAVERCARDIFTKRLGSDAIAKDGENLPPDRRWLRCDARSVELRAICRGETQKQGGGDTLMTHGV